MIDVEGDVFDAVARAVIAEFPDALLSGEFEEAPAIFPAVYLTETSNVTDTARSDSSMREKGALLTYTANIYSNDFDDRKSTCKRIAQVIDGCFSAMSFRRSFMQPIDNAADPSIYRIVGRWTGYADQDSKFYRR